MHFCLTQPETWQLQFKICWAALASATSGFSSDAMAAGVTNPGGTSPVLPSSCGSSCSTLVTSWMPPSAN